MATGTIPFNKKEYGLQSYLVMNSNKTVTLNAGLHIVIVKAFGNQTKYGVYIATRSDGAGEHSLIPLKTGTDAPNLSVSGNDLTLTGGTNSWEMSIINLTEFRS